MPEEHIQSTADQKSGGVPLPQRAEERISSLPMAKPLAAPKPVQPPEIKDNVREIVETIVFVAVLVLLLKTFVAEAFVIPTGSMAPTLLGYHKKVTCEQCGYNFLLNASSEGDPQRGIGAQWVIGGYCPNCRFYNQILRLEQPPPQGPLP
jgi:signal peptidase I